MCQSILILKRPFFFGLALALLPFGANAQESSVERDLYFWGYYEFEFVLHKDWNILFKNQVRLNENVSRFDYTAIDLEIEHETADWLRLSATYRYNLKNDLEDGWLNRHQVRGTASLRYEVDDFRFYNRSRIQTGVEDAFGVAEVSNNDLFYRNRTRVKYSITNRWDVFGYFESYWRLGARAPDEGYIFRKRYGLGADFEVNSRESIRFFYVMDEQIRNSRPSWRYFMGFGYSRTFDLN